MNRVEKPVSGNAEWYEGNSDEASILSAGGSVDDIPYVRLSRRGSGDALGVKRGATEGSGRRKRGMNVGRVSRKWNAKMPVTRCRES